MKLFLDTADLQAIKAWIVTGVIDGVTTNPTLLYKAGVDPVHHIKNIAKLLEDRPISVEITEKDADAIYDQAKLIAALAPNVVVKIPCHIQYYAVIKRLVDEHVSLNITLVFSLMQALAMSKLGVLYISPFIGRLDDIHESGIALIHDIRLMLDHYKFSTQLLAASIRSVEHLHEVIVIGADVATVPTEVLEHSLQHSLTEKGMQKFLDDWQKLGVRRFP